MPTISARADGSGSQILWLPEALKRHPTHDVVLWVRCSTTTQENRGDLEKQSQRLLKSVRAYGCRFRARFERVEKGDMGRPRLEFQHALKAARHLRAILVAQDASRFLRGEKGDADEPNPEDWKQFNRLTKGLMLATVIDPSVEYRRAHSMKTIMGMKASEKHAGRPLKLTRKMLLKILELREEQGPTYGPLGIGSIARRLGITHRQVTTALNLKVPDGDGGWIRFVEFGAFPSPLHYFLRLEKSGSINDLLSRLAPPDPPYRKGEIDQPFFS